MRQRRDHRARLTAALALLLSAAATSAADAPLELVQTLTSKGKPGKLDHLALDAKHDRLFLANKANNSLDIFDLKEGKLLKQVTAPLGDDGAWPPAFRPAGEFVRECRNNRFSPWREATFPPPAFAQRCAVGLLLH